MAIDALYVEKKEEMGYNDIIRIILMAMLICRTNGRDDIDICCY